MTISGAALIFINIGIIGYGQDKAMMTARFFCLISLQTRNTAQKDSRLFSFRNNNGNFIFESHNNVECKVEKQYTDKASGKQYPSILDYTFKQDDTFVDTRYLKMNIF